MAIKDVTPEQIEKSRQLYEEFKEAFRSLQTALNEAQRIAESGELDQESPLVQQGYENLMVVRERLKGLLEYYERLGTIH
jgi:hypothetical protein